jgi:hypothetical protein
LFPRISTTSVKIAPSEFALPYEPREQGNDPPEHAMGFRPHSAYWAKPRVNLNGLVEFWGISGMMRMDL